MPTPRKPLAPTYGRWTVIDQSTRPMVRCRCVCGSERMVRVYCLSDGSTRSCGCWEAERRRERTRKAWTGPGNPNWKDGQYKNIKERRLVRQAAAARRREMSKIAQAEAEARAARFDAAIAADAAAAERWVIEHAAEIPKVLPYMLDYPWRFCHYDTIERGFKEFDDD